MITVTPAAEAALRSAVRRTRIRGTINDDNFTEKSILAGSLSIVRQASDSRDFLIGGVFVSTLKMTFLRQVPLVESYMGYWLGSVITLQFGICTSEENDTWEEIPLGTFYVAEAKREADGIVITAYDGMYKLDKEIYGMSLSGAYWNILNKIANKANVALGQTRNEIEALTNASGITYDLYAENDCNTCRDVLYWLTQIVGGFAFFKDNKLFIKDYHAAEGSAGTPEITFSQYQRTGSCKFADYHNNYQELLLTHTEDGLDYYHQTYSLEEGRVYRLGENPFFQFATGYQNWVCGNLITVLRKYQYWPSDVEIPCDPRIELGDRYKCYDGITGAPLGLMSAVQYISFNYGKNMVIKCFGQNPVQANYADSTHGSGGGHSTAGDQIRSKTLAFFTNENPSDVTIEAGDDPKRIAYVNFSADVPTVVDMWQAVKYSATFSNAAAGDAYLKATLYMDSQKLNFEPKFLVANGTLQELTFDDTINISAFRTLQNTGRHTWEIYLEIVDESNTLSSVTILQGDSVGVLKGQGLNQESIWNGVISVSENVPKIAGAGEVKTISETGPELILDGPQIISTADNFTKSAPPLDFGALYELCEINTGFHDEWMYCGEGLLGYLGGGYCGDSDTLI